MIFSANISKALCLAAMGISLMMPAPVAAATPAMAVETQAVNAQGAASPSSLTRMLSIVFLPSWSASRVS